MIPFTASPDLSVAWDHWWTIEIKASTDEDFGMAPYWLESMVFRTAGDTYFTITNSSAILEIAGVREIGRKCLFTSVTGFSLGIGVMSACFQIGGNFCSSKEVLRIMQNKHFPEIKVSLACNFSF